MSDNNADNYDAYLTQLLELPPGPERDNLLELLKSATATSLQPDLYMQSVRVLEVADLLWAEGFRAPALDEDPIAAMLGLVPDSRYQLDSRAFKRALQASGLKPTGLAAALTRRGWEVATRDVFGWEGRGASRVSPALLRVVAQVLNVDPDRITATADAGAAPQPTATLSVADEVAASPKFRQVVERYARLRGMTERMAASALHSGMVATVHRGEHPTVAQMLASVEAMVDALEANSEDT